MPLTPTSTNDGIVLTDLSVAIPLARTDKKKDIPPSELSGILSHQNESRMIKTS
jgi:hypothetical protein